MKRVWISLAFGAAAFSALAACANEPQTYRDLERLGSDYQRQVDRGNAETVGQSPSQAPSPALPAGEDACGASRFQSLIGRHQNDIDRASLPSATRILCHDCMATMDFRPDRLNVELDEREVVTKVRCG